MVAGFAGRLGALGARHPIAVLGATTVVFVAAMAGALRVRVDSSLLDPFGPNDEAVRVTRAIEDGLGGVRRVTVDVEAGEPGQLLRADVLKATQALRDPPSAPGLVLSSLGPGDVLDELLRAFAPGARPGESYTRDDRIAALADIAAQTDPALFGRTLSPDGSRARITFGLATRGTRRTAAFLRELETRARAMEQRFPGLSVRLGGEGYAASRGLGVLLSDLGKSLAVATLLIFAVMAFVFRSVRLGLLSIPPNLVPLAGTGAYMAARGIPLDASTAILFAVALGLAVDGTIHLIARVREERGRGASVEHAIELATRTTGRSVVVSSSTLVLGFLVLLSSGFLPVRQLGELCAVTICMCLVADLVVLPALLARFPGVLPSGRRSPGWQPREDVASATAPLA